MRPLPPVSVRPAAGMAAKNDPPAAGVERDRWLPGDSHVGDCPFTMSNAGVAAERDARMSGHACRKRED